MTDQETHQSFLHRWKEGIKNLTPAQQMKARYHGYIGGFIGLAMALVVFIYRIVTDFDWLQLAFAIFVFFLSWQQAISAIGEKQRYEGMAEMEIEIGIGKEPKEEQ